MAKLKKSRDKVFLNIPYDYKPFERLFIAYIAGISALGMVPHATLLADFAADAGTVIRLIPAKIFQRKSCVLQNLEQ